MGFEELRVAFETWALVKFGPDSLARSSNGDDYRRYVVQRCWEAWCMCSSRSAPKEVKLTKEQEFEQWAKDMGLGEGLGRNPYGGYADMGMRTLWTAWCSGEKKEVFNSAQEMRIQHLIGIALDKRLNAYRPCP